MKLLLDTHTFLWFVNDNPKLSNHLKDLIEDTSTLSYMSIASLWEMSIKFNLGKKTIDILNIELEHLILNPILISTLFL